MVALLSLITVVSWGTWIPLAQAVPGVPQRARTLCVTIGNVAFAAAALAVAGGRVQWGWRGFWLPVAGGVVWTGGNYAAFRASEVIGLARAAGSWTPLNILVAFGWGAALFGELDHLSGARFAVLGGALVLVLAGVLVIVRSRPAQPAGTSGGVSQPGRGLLWAATAGVLWGSYFVPAQWARTSAQVSNVPLAIGMLAGGLALMLSRRGPVRLPVTGAAVTLAAGVLFGIGNLALLGLVSRVGTGVGFTIGQLSLLVNAGIGIWVFKAPPPGSRAAKLAMTGILIAGSGGMIIGALR